ncbi:REST corepressor 3-like [Panonychus citri]|uniref:REST corepressor 3-like n=1 Tax=Panonychus citri TaxID=50023 RepID=UPI002307ABC3|nr:REST corepressor 3-like [Panonychus citri]XP_053208130.1 REST corepressor 3-like [Panonychus citri]
METFMLNPMRVGSEYQAVVPEVSTVLPKPAPEYEPEHAVLIWSPSNGIPPEKLDEFIQICLEKYNYKIEQALGMLCWHKYNLETALADLPNFTPLPDDWSVEDKVLFEQAFQFHDKHFHKIKQMLPDKSIANLVKYYYSWKKTRSRTSLMDRQARRFIVQKEDGSEAGSDGLSDNENESINEFSNNGDTKDNPDGKTRCSNCATTASGQFHNTSKGVLCRSCYSFWRRTGLMKNITTRKQDPSGSSRPNLMKSKRKPPRGMSINIDDLMTIVNGPPDQGEAFLRSLSNEIVNLKRNVQNLKAHISQIKTKTNSAHTLKRLDVSPSQRINARWTNEEALLAVQGVRKHGKDFKAIAEIVGNKSESHVRSFYTNNERRYNLAYMLTEYENEFLGTN